MTARQPLFPFAPLQRLLERRLPEYVLDTDRGPQIIHAGDLERASEVLGISRPTLTRWKAGCLLPADSADHCATRLAHHPTEIWPDWNDVLDELARERAEIRRARYRRHNERRHRLTA